jgi:F1F0 ATPase subunit 2
MNEMSTMVLPLVLSLFGGVLLGIIFFGGLWWTIQRGVSSRNPATQFAGSLFLRTAITLAGFYFIAHGDWRKMLACLLGFSGARVCVTRLTRRGVEAPAQILQAGKR